MTMLGPRYVFQKLQTEILTLRIRQKEAGLALLCF